MPYIKTVPENEATGKLKPIYDGAIQRAGKVANIVQLMSLDDDACAASLQLYLATMKSKNSLDPATREMLATVVSNANDCFY